MTVDLEVAELRTAASPIKSNGEDLSGIGLHSPRTVRSYATYDPTALSSSGQKFPEVHDEYALVDTTFLTRSGTALGSWDDLGVYYRTQPNPEVLESAIPLLSEKLNEALNLLLTLVRGETERLFIPVLRTEVRGYVDPDEGDAQIIVTQYLNMGPRAAFEYWDMISLVISFWKDSLPISLAFVVDNRLDLEVRWVEPAV